MTDRPTTTRGPSDPAGVGGPASSPDPATDLADEWVPGPDGLPYRRAARVLLLDDADRLLLVRGHDVDQPERSWWFTVGGGMAPGEDPRTAAVREVREETGLLLDGAALVGPVLTRSAIFDFASRTCRQDEEIFLARVRSGVRLGTEGWTELEADVLDEMRWWVLDDLTQVQTEVYPEGLADLVRPLLGGWDGVTRHLGLQHD